ncbi:hypothetical protein Bbelb_015640 [Branchiostoma belcheri]|nr:hypothetical protein Bbelb_015640 [Branchiostoma belcheri]
MKRTLVRSDEATTCKGENYDQIYAKDETFPKRSAIFLSDGTCSAANIQSEYCRCSRLHTSLVPRINRDRTRSLAFPPNRKPSLPVSFPKIGNLGGTVWGLGGMVLIVPVFANLTSGRKERPTTRGTVWNRVSEVTPTQEETGSTGETAKPDTLKLQWTKSAFFLEKGHVLDGHCVVGHGKGLSLALPHGLERKETVCDRLQL